MLSQKLKSLRATKGISQVKLAEQMGVTQGTVGKWETNRRIPDVEMLRKLSNYFSVSIDYLLDNDQSPELLLLARISELPKEDKDKLIDEFSDTIEAYLKNRKSE